MTDVVGRQDLDAALLAQLRAQLQAELDHLLEQAGLTRDDLVDPEDPTMGHDAVTTAIETMARTGIARTSQALARLDGGTYGNCLDCGGAIPAERLEIMPATPYCVGCQQRNE